MKIKLDENLPAELCGVLNQHGHEVDTVLQERLKGRGDGEVWEAAQREGRFFITQDIEFGDIREHAPGTHHGLLLLRLFNPVREDPLKRLKEVFEREDMSSWQGCTVVVTEQKVRVRRA